LKILPNEEFKPQTSIKILEEARVGVNFRYTKVGPSITKVFMTRFGGWLFVYTYNLEIKLKENLNNLG